MAVYFIRAGKRGPVKIGFALDPVERLAALQVGNHCALELLAVMPGGLADEEILHIRFAADRTRGEWFVVSAEMLSLISAHRYEPPAPDFIDALGGNSGLAAAFGLSPSTVSMWRQRGVSWPHRHAVAQLARDKRVKLPKGFLGALPKPSKATTAPAPRQSRKRATSCGSDAA